MTVQQDFPIGRRLDVSSLEIPEGKLAEVTGYGEYDFSGNGPEDTVELRVGKWLVEFGANELRGCPVVEGGK